MVSGFGHAYKRAAEFAANDAVICTHTVKGRGGI